MKRLPAFVFILVATVGAGSSIGCDDPLCVTFIEVENDSATNESYDVVIDDEVVGTLSPGQSDRYDVTSGSHTVQVNFTSGGVACASFTKLMRQCQFFGFTCDS